MKMRELLKIVTRSSGWSKVRRERLRLDGYKCRCCGSANGLEVHHIEPFSDHPELELDIENTVTLCNHPCHLFVGHLNNFKSYNPNAKEDIEEWKRKIASKPK